SIGGGGSAGRGGAGSGSGGLSRSTGGARVRNHRGLSASMRVHVFALLACLSCATTTAGVVPLTSSRYVQKPSDYAIPLYSAQLPTCPFEGIAIRRQGCGGRCLARAT